MRFHYMLALLLVAAGAGEARASVLIKLELPNLVAHAQAVIQGEVMGSRSYWTADRRSIETETELRVERTVQGKVEGRTVKVRTLGGKVGDIRMHVPGSPRFSKGQQVVLFLTSRAGHRWVLGMNQGVFDLSKTADGSRVVRQRMAGASLVHKTADGLKPARGPRISQELGGFVQQLEKLRLRCKKEADRCRVR